MVDLDALLIRRIVRLRMSPLGHNDTGYAAVLMRAIFGPVALIYHPDATAFGARSSTQERRSTEALGRAVLAAQTPLATLCRGQR